MSPETSLRQNFKSGKTLPYDWRLKQLKGLESLLLNEKEKIAEALGADLKRPLFEVENFEINPTLGDVRYAIRNLKSWMKPEAALTPPVLQMGSSRIERIPKGVVLVLGAWNFPFNLSLAPCIAAIAAGNCVVLKPSDVSPTCAKTLKELCEKYLDPSAFRVYLGEVPESTELLARKWDHIFYTGNAVIAKVVLTAAAKHLCPVTLELGGKSPVIVDRGLSASQLKVAVSRILSSGLFVNAGQICVSPDYILVHKDAEQDLLQALKAGVARLNPQNSSEQLGKVVNARHFARLKNLMETSKGETICGGADASSGADPAACFLPPTVISRPSLESPAMTEEIFGPLITVTPVESLEAAADFINSRETPLALYVFSGNRKRAEQMIASTRSGGAVINDTFVHLASCEIPFGGCNESGFGAYHGKYGFEEFSHKRSILSRPLYLDIDRYPPYDNFKHRLVAMAMTLPEFMKAILGRTMLCIGW